MELITLTKELLLESLKNEISKSQEFLLFDDLAVTLMCSREQLIKFVQQQKDETLLQYWEIYKTKVNGFLSKNEGKLNDISKAIISSYPIKTDKELPPIVFYFEQSILQDKILKDMDENAQLTKRVLNQANDFLAKEDDEEQG